MRGPSARVERLEQRAARAGDAHAARAQRDDGSGERGRGERLGAMGDGHGVWVPVVRRPPPLSRLDPLCAATAADRITSRELRHRLRGQREADDDDQRGDTAGTAATTRGRAPAAARAAARRGRPRCPRPVSVAASPAENATIRTSPSPIRCCATAPSSTTSADGHGISPADAPSASRLRRVARRVRRVVVMVVVVVVPWCVVVRVVVAVVVRVPDRAEARAQHRGADADDEQAGREREPRVQLLGQDPRRQRERDHPEREHAGRVGDGHGRAEQRPRRACCRACRRGTRRPSPCRGRARARAARPSRTRRAAAARARRRRRAGRRSRSAARVRRRRGPRPSAGGRASPSPGRDVEARRALVARAREQVLGVAPQPAGRVGGRRVGAHVGARARARLHGDPADAAGERRRRAARPTRAPRTGARSGSSSRVVAQPALSRRAASAPARRRAAARRRGRRRRASRPRATSRALARQHLGVAQPALAERRDLRLVEHVAHVDAVVGDARPSTGG